MFDLKSLDTRTTEALEGIARVMAVKTSLEIIDKLYSIGGLNTEEYADLLTDLQSCLK